MSLFHLTNSLTLSLSLSLSLFLSLSVSVFHFQEVLPAEPAVEPSHPETERDWDVPEDRHQVRSQQEAAARSLLPKVSHFWTITLGSAIK